MKIISRRTQKRLKDAFYTVASHFISYFQEQTYTSTGYKPKEITFHSLEPLAIVGRNRKLYIYEVNYSSEMGFHKSKLAIKVFDAMDKVLQEASGNQILRYVLEGNPEVKTPQLLYYSKDFQLLIYEGLFAEEFSNSKINESEKYYLAGRALASVHNKELKNLDLQRYYMFVENIFNKLFDSNLIPSKTLEELRDKIVSEIEEKMFYSYGGSRSFGDYHVGNIMFEQQTEKVRNLGLKSDKFQIFLIDPEFIEDCIENTCVDRFEDIGTFFAKILLEDFIKTAGKPKKVLNDLRDFLKGYNSIFERYKIKLKDMYPRGITLELQMVFAILFDVLYYIGTSENDEWLRSAIQARLSYIDYLFQYPFENSV
ncbi:MAG: hypothetical protein HeimC3_44740 [Candidatus Heimdallarchaeota archaeon LC_3]|nr:MAG: hypothetical protein HeimC3_44740 [Candidatus Heimdallarchaeota archaeon LC_3]